MVKNFFELDVWKIAHQLGLILYELTAKFPQSELFGITSQIRRASFSVGANIAEGFGRYHFKDKQKFYFQARGSLAEVQNFLFVAKDLKLIDEKVFKVLFAKTEEVYKLLNGLVKAQSVK